MYPLGFLFGLGFDTATEIGLLGISAAKASQGLVGLVHPGLSGAVHRRHVADGHDRRHIDAGRLRLGLRQADPQALLQPDDHGSIGCHGRWSIGGMEALDLSAMSSASRRRPFWGMIGALNDNFGVLGYVIVGIFVAAWVISTPSIGSGSSTRSKWRRANTRSTATNSPLVRAAVRPTLRAAAQKERSSHDGRPRQGRTAALRT